MHVKQFTLEVKEQAAYDHNKMKSYLLRGAVGFLQFYITYVELAAGTQEALRINCLIGMV
jgi:hypothetical protein